MHFVRSMYALAIFTAHGSECFIRSIYSKIEQVSDERPSRRPRRERRARPPDKTSNKVQCQTGKADVKDVNPHNCNSVELLYSRRSVDGYLPHVHAIRTSFIPYDSGAGTPSDVTTGRTL